MASDGLSVITTSLVRGLQDGVLGIFKIYNLDESRVVKPTIREPRSTLARRRFEMMKEEEKSRPMEVKSEPRVVHRIVRCCAWNGGIFWLSIMLFNNLLMPFLQYFTESVFYGSVNQNIIWSTIRPIISWTFSALWVLPLFVLSKVINGLWFQDIADSAYRQSRGRPVKLHSISKMIADVLFSLLLQGLFLMQALLSEICQFMRVPGRRRMVHIFVFLPLFCGTVAWFLPIRGIGDLVSLIHFAMLYAVYAFEYKWINMGWEVHRRLSYVETNWPYFVGFGLPLSLLTALQSSYVMSGCVFSILFPLFIISANEAEPINDLQCPYPLRIFSPVIKITNFICTRLISAKPPPVTVDQQQQQQQQQDLLSSNINTSSPSCSSSPTRSTRSTSDSPSKRYTSRSRDLR